MAAFDWASCDCIKALSADLSSADLSSTDCVSRMMSSNRLPDESQKALGCMSMGGASSSFALSSCSRLLTSSLIFSASVFQDSPAFTVLVVSAACMFATYGLKPPPGIGGGVIPTSSAARASVWCASVRRSRSATGMLSRASLPSSPSASGSSLSTKPAAFRKSMPAAKRPTFCWKVALPFFKRRFLGSSGAPSTPSTSLRSVRNASSLSLASGMVAKCWTATSIIVASGKPWGAS
mmetsp:Transcript_99854/g.253945  ORF Transcript_99854/g.253945 Transcript_99854/m.253945 type:complete len:236 (-) Transcript_99854:84-791(-)